LLCTKFPIEEKRTLTIPRIYSPSALEEGKPCRLGTDNYKYLKQVMRLQPGARITVFDGFGCEYSAAIKGFTKDDVEVELGEKKEQAGKEIKIIVAQALPKAHKMDVIVRSAAELGADEILPFAAARSVSRVTQEKGSSKAARWQKIAREAARCCRSSQITNIHPISSFEEMLAHEDSGALKMIFWEEEELRTIKDLLTDQARLTIKNFFVIIGPEGGFTRDEVFQAKEAGFISVSLGKQILKVESAAPAIVTIIQYEKGIFGKTSGR
jgi:16S rRNA (uracil1498-N3)-methyltransferase